MSIKSSSMFAFSYFYRVKSCLAVVYLSWIIISKVPSIPIIFPDLFERFDGFWEVLVLGPPFDEGGAARLKLGVPSIEDHEGVCQVGLPNQMSKLSL